MNEGASLDPRFLPDSVTGKHLEITSLLEREKNERTPDHPSEIVNRIINMDNNIVSREDLRKAHHVVAILENLATLATNWPAVYKNAKIYVAAEISPFFEEDAQIIEKAEKKKKEKKKAILNADHQYPVDNMEITVYGLRELQSTDPNSAQAIISTIFLINDFYNNEERKKHLQLIIDFMSEIESTHDKTSKRRIRADLALEHTVLDAVSILTNYYIGRQAGQETSDEMTLFFDTFELLSKHIDDLPDFLHLVSGETDINKLAIELEMQNPESLELLQETLDKRMQNLATRNIYILTSILLHRPDLIRRVDTIFKNTKRNFENSINNFRDILPSQDVIRRARTTIPKNGSGFYKKFIQDGFNPTKAIELTNGPIVEIGGPTEKGYEFVPIYERIQQKYPERVLITNIAPGLPKNNPDTGELVGYEYPDKIDARIDATHLPFGQNSVGTILMSNMPVNIMQDAITEAHRVIESGGYLVIQGIDANDIYLLQKLGFELKAGSRTYYESIGMFLFNLVLQKPNDKKARQ